MSEKRGSSGVEYITSRKNPLISRLRRLGASRSLRRQEGLFLCDGTKLLDEALRWGAVPELVLSVPGQSLPPLEGTRRVELPRELLEYLSPMEAPQGVLFLCKMPPLQPPERLEGGRYLVLDGLQDPGNVGTIWRTADALGADGLLLTGGCADPFNPKTVRASMGAVFRLPVYELEREALPALCRRSALPLYATALREDSCSLRGLSLRRAALVIGNEGHGVSQELLEVCTQSIQIPMRARCESLNAAAAATILLWELYRNGEVVL